MHESDIDEALRLIETSKSSLLDEKRKTPQDAMSAIFTLVKQMCTRANGTLERQVKYFMLTQYQRHQGAGQSQGIQR